MLRRLKTLNPKYKAVAAIWLGVEILSIPAAAAVMAAGWTVQPNVIAERVNQHQSGTAIYIVTHTTAFEVAVQDAAGDVHVDVQGTTDPLGRAIRTSGCASLDTSHIRVVETVEGPEADYATTVVTLTYEDGIAPEITFAADVLAPTAQNCVQEPTHFPPLLGEVAERSEGRRGKV